MPPHEGDLVNGKYRVVRQLGEGGMGSVCEALHERLGTRVALKFLHHEYAQREEIMQRFVQEARLVASIKSPHVVQVNDVEQTSDGTWFMVLEYLEGRTLQRVHHDLHHEGRRLTQAESLSLALQILEGASAAHAVGIVHRDLKPDNVMIVEGSHGEPFVKLLDFGIAKLRQPVRDATPGMTRPGIVMGTPEYMAPEQAFAADAVDARADVFAIGVMAFEMLAGCRPVAGDDPQILAAVHLAGDVPRVESIVPDLPAGLGDVVHKAMSARAADRYASGAEFLAALEPFVAAMFGPAPVVRGPQDLIGQKTALLESSPLATSQPSPAGAIASNPTPIAGAFGTVALNPSPAVIDSRTSALPVSVAGASLGASPPPSSAARIEPAPTTRPAVVFPHMHDAPTSESSVIKWNSDEESVETAMSPGLANAPRSVGGGTLALTDGAVVAEPPSHVASAKQPSTTRPTTPSRRPLWIALGVVVFVVSAVSIGLYVAHPSFLDDEPHTRPTAHPHSTTKKPPVKKPH